MSFLHGTGSPYSACAEEFPRIEVFEHARRKNNVDPGTNTSVGEKASKKGNPQGNIQIALKYSSDTKTPAIRKLERISKPGFRKYAKSDNLPRVLNGLGIAILSTSKGVMTNKEAQREKLGGEVLCYVY